MTDIPRDRLSPRVWWARHSAVRMCVAILPWPSHHQQRKMPAVITALAPTRMLTPSLPCFADHYHALPTAFFNCSTGWDSTNKAWAPSAPDGRHSPLVGWALDGYPIFGPFSVGGTVPDDLDSCYGHVRCDPNRTARTRCMHCGHRAQTMASPPQTHSPFGYHYHGKRVHDGRTHAFLSCFRGLRPVQPFDGQGACATPRPCRCGVCRHPRSESFYSRLVCPFSSAVPPTQPLLPLAPVPPGSRPPFAAGGGPPGSQSPGGGLGPAPPGASLPPAKSCSTSYQTKPDQTARCCGDLWCDSPMETAGSCPAGASIILPHRSLHLTHISAGSLFVAD